MIRIANAALLLACSLLLPLAAQAADPAPIGYVMTVNGEASVTANGKTVPAMAGTPVTLGAQLKTGPAGSMGVTLKDNTVMSFGPNTVVTVDKYLFAPASGDLSLSAKITSGTMNFISGIIAKLKPEAVAIDTPTGTIGVRGTQFLVKVDG